ncbi:cell envelope biogenesis protein TonB [Thermaurantimonas aggregans]|uniref:Cell envelope biogenesis protein TonB n=1 Tax=Thermaurantimonas aggregans TaxID=2173829 RepID=A0A401XM69_9FLAO|nr:energy transducer TonB [Thermaurantimonas aggregans]MCX8147961.1 TonB family protein [Thermaurantimonas aggregans]GCD78092.1 cell envelope biogenesis protein TonB [Thermaurantimonas aggregans]
MKLPDELKQWEEWLYYRRNKLYGSFVERHKIWKREWIGLFVSGVLILAIYGSPLLVYKIKSAREKDAIKVEQLTVVSYSQLLQPPPIEMVNQPQQTIEKPAEVSTIKFVKPEIKKDEEVREETYVPTQEEFQKANPGTETVKGIDSVVIDQQNVKVKEDESENVLFAVVEIKPEFPGGREALMRYLAENIKYPQIARELNIQGVVIVQFTVDKSGQIRDVEIARGIGGGCDEEALRVVKNMPAWSPGRQNNRPVNVRYALPIRFALKD